MIELGNGVFFIADKAKMMTATSYPDAYSCAATREDNEENRLEAADEGYTGPDAVWQALCEHEIAHTLLCRWFFGRESYVLRHESKAERNR